MSIELMLERIRCLLESAHGPRLKGVVLYGSMARGEQRQDSDIDILVLLDSVNDYGTDLRKNIAALYPLARELGRRISAKPVAEDVYAAAECPLYRHARKEGIAA